MATDGSYEKITELLHEVDEKLQALDASGIHGKHITQDLGLNSLDVIKFILLVEEKFGVRLADEDIDSKELMKVDNLAEHVSKGA